MRDLAPPHRLVALADFDLLEDRIENAPQRDRTSLRPRRTIEPVVHPENAERCGEEVRPFLKPEGIGGIDAGAASGQNQNGPELVRIEAAIDHVDRAG